MKPASRCNMLMSPWSRAGLVVGGALAPLAFVIVQLPRRKAIPVPVMLIHAGVAVVALVLLAMGLFGGG